MRPGTRAPATAVILALVVALAGLAMVQWGRAMPAFVDHQRAMDAFLAWCSPTGGIDRAIGDRYRTLMTARYNWINAGVGIGFSGLVAAMLAFGLAIRRRPGELWLRTPRSRWGFIGIGFGIIAWSWAGMITGLELDLARNHFPPCADTIFIPAVGLTTIAAILAIVLTLIGFAITWGFGALPAALLTPNGPRRGRAIAVNLSCAVAALIVLIVGGLMTRSADAFATPSYLIALYLIASTRAALLAGASA